MGDALQRSVPPRRAAALAATALAALAAVTLTPHSTGAAAAPEPLRTLSAAEAARLATSLTAELKGAGAGSYYDSAAKKLVVNVTTSQAAAAVRTAGAEPRTVRFDAARLRSAMSTLDKTAEIPGTTWGIDPRSNKVQVTADPTVDAVELAKLNTAMKSLGQVAELKRTTTELKAFIQGGDAVYGRDRDAKCSLGFSVKRAGLPDAFLTAGHCGDRVKSWAEKQNGPEFAKTTAARFPGDDHAVAEYIATVDHPSSVNLYESGSLPVSGARDAVVGEKVGRSGDTTKAHFGTVQALDQTVTYAEGRVTGLVRTDACAEPGDSGGPFFTYDPNDPPATTTALGLVSGGDGNCLLGGTTFFQPVTEALTAYGATIP